MAKMLAKHHRFFINTGADAVPEWTQIKGIGTFTWSTKRDGIETTDFDSTAKEFIPGTPSYELKLEGQLVTGDAGQEAVEDLETKYEDEGLVKFKVVNTKTNTSKVFLAMAATEVGGGNDEATKWTCTLTVSNGITKGTETV